MFSSGVTCSGSFVIADVVALASVAYAIVASVAYAIFASVAYAIVAGVTPTASFAVLLAC